MSLLIQWDETFETGNQEVDIQHKKLISVLNSFYRSVIQSNSDSMKELIGELEEYTKYHFSTEEKIYEANNYENIIEHIEAHNNFIKQIGTYKDKLQSGKMILTLDVSNYLKEWIIHHIKKNDIIAFQEIQKKDQS